MLFNAVQAYNRAKGRGLTILPPGTIYPIDWRRTVWGPKDGPGALFGNWMCACSDTVCELLTVVDFLVSKVNFMDVIISILAGWENAMKGCWPLQVMSSAYVILRILSSMKDSARRVSQRHMPLLTGHTRGLTSMKRQRERSAQSALHGTLRPCREAKL
jgi:hypothetical protein